MSRTKSSVMMMALASMTMVLLMGLAGCSQGYYGEVGPGWGAPYGDAGPEWDGRVFVQGGYDRDYHPQAFRAEGGGRPAVAGSDRGRASLGARTSGGGHAPSGGGGHAPAGGHAPSGGGRK